MPIEFGAKSRGSEAGRPDDARPKLDRSFNALHVDRSAKPFRTQVEESEALYVGAEASSQKGESGMSSSGMMGETQDD
jgi:hypothetical protein